MVFDFTDMFVYEFSWIPSLLETGFKQSNLVYVVFFVGVCSCITNAFSGDNAFVS